MAAEITVPSLGESVTEATVARWMKSEGDAVAQDEPIVELETDKVSIEVNAPASGVLKSITVQEGDTVEVGAVLGSVEEGEGKQASGGGKKEEKKEEKKETKQDAAPPPSGAPQYTPAAASGTTTLGPAARKLAAEHDIQPQQIPATGRGGQVATKGDVLKVIEGGVTSAPAESGPREERVKMTKLRQTIARRLKQSQENAAILTTFNEIDMSAIMNLRSEYKDAFEKKYGFRLGFMGMFAKAAVSALKAIPEVNAQIDGDEIIYKNYYDIGVAVGTEQGLVVPVIRDCDRKSVAAIEHDIGDLAKKARNGQLSMKEMTGGTFTISNGGVYGSLMSTPILNPPQSGILGLHKIEKRPVAVGDEIKIRPMMYVALSYDHRIIDGRESVTFLVKVKEAIEDPRRLLLDL